MQTCISLWLYIVMHFVWLTSLKHSYFDSFISPYLRVFAIQLQETIYCVTVETVLVCPCHLIPWQCADVLPVPLPVCLCSVGGLQAPTPWRPRNSGVCAVLLGVHLSMWRDSSGWLLRHEHPHTISRCKVTLYNLFPLFQLQYSYLNVSCLLSFSCFIIQIKAGSALSAF